MNQEVFAALGEAMKRAEDVALVTIVATNGSTPQRVGAKMLVYADGRTVGTIGGGCYENDAFWKAKASLESRKPARVKYELDDDFAQENGLVCGGQMEVFIEPIEPPPAVYIIGAGHVGYYLGKFAHESGFQVHVVDDRDTFANHTRFPEAAEVVVDEVPAWLANAALPPSAYVVIVTRGHRHDLDALRAVVQRDLRYVGLIGSKAKVARVYEALVEEGVDPARFTRIHAPIGLDLGAVTPQEIAVSIVAELIAVRRGRASDPAVASASLKWMPRFDRTPSHSS